MGGQDNEIGIGAPGQRRDRGDRRSGARFAAGVEPDLWGDTSQSGRASMRGVADVADVADVALVFIGVHKVSSSLVSLRLEPLANQIGVSFDRPV